MYRREPPSYKNFLTLDQHDQLEAGQHAASEGSCIFCILIIFFFSSMLQLFLPFMDILSTLQTKACYEFEIFIFFMKNVGGDITLSLFSGYDCEVVSPAVS